MAVVVNTQINTAQHLNTAHSKPAESQNVKEVQINKKERAEQAAFNKRKVAKAKDIIKAAEDRVEINDIRRKLEAARNSSATRNFEIDAVKGGYRFVIDDEGKRVLVKRFSEEELAKMNGLFLSA